MLAREFIRNFCIIAHVDHGKSTLADRFLEITGVLPSGKHEEQFLDQNPISRERGITIKLAPVRMNYAFNSQLYTLNLIDTPGHVDFSYEVSRTLAACEGAVLLVDATQGIQAQTVAHFQAAKKENLVIIPVINKIDLPNAQPKEVSAELQETFGFAEEEILYISAKTGENVEKVLKTIVQKVSAPKQPKYEYFRALVFDAMYDEHRGAVAFVRVFDGKVGSQDTIRLVAGNVVAEVSELGYFSPSLKPVGGLAAGEIGYIITGIKDIHKIQVGDTITIQNSPASLHEAGRAEFPPKARLARGGRIQNVEALAGYKQPKPMVFFGVYPRSTDEFITLRKALEKLALADSSLSFSEEHSSFLGSGFRVGFLGLLHAEIVKERLKREWGAEPLLTSPSVLYQKENGALLEPYIKLTIYAPKNYVGSLTQLCQKRKGILIDISYHLTYAILSYEIPYTVFIRGLSSDVKSVSSGFASIDYELIGFRPADLVELEIRVNDAPIDVLSEFVYRADSAYLAREKAEKLKTLLPRKQFRQIIQGIVEGKIISRAEISPLRKDVIKKLSGGDRTRKDKLLKKQKKGKEKLFTVAKVDIPQEALFSFLRGS